MPETLPDAGLQRDLLPVNAVIGFLKRDRRWPSALYKLGYRLSMIDQLVTAPPAGTAEVDVICLKHTTNHAMLWECKSGKTLNGMQARVYAAITAEDVQRTGNVTFPRPTHASVEPVYCCLEAQKSAVVNALATWGLTIPVVGLGKTAQLASGRLLTRKRIASSRQASLCHLLKRYPGSLSRTPIHRRIASLLPCLPPWSRSCAGRGKSSPRDICFRKPFRIGIAWARTSGGTCRQQRMTSL
jgi:hypothetical protein